jgi:hypothetical protein
MPTFSAFKQQPNLLKIPLTDASPAPASRM